MLVKVVAIVMRKDILVTVIIPVYNVKAFVEKAIRSVMKQTYEALQIIIINDGATDGSAEICKKIAKEDTRIELYNKTNGGLSSARNYGMKFAKADWILFLDADDWLDEKCIQSCVDDISMFDCDGVIFPFIREFKGKSKFNYTMGKEKKYVQGKKILGHLYGSIKKEHCSPLTMDDLNTACGKFYKRSLIENIEFIDSNYIGDAEDLAFNAEVFIKVRGVIYDPTIFYHYNKMNETSITSSWNENLIVTQNNLYNTLYKLLNNYELSNEYYVGVKYRRVFGILTLILNIVRSKNSLNDKYNILNDLLGDELIKERLDNIDIKTFPMKWRIILNAVKGKNTFVLLMLFIIANSFRQYLK